MCNLNAKALESAMKYLHSLGILIWFGEDSKLKQMVILDPHWLASVMATLFTTRVRFGLLLSLFTLTAPMDQKWIVGAFDIASNLERLSNGHLHFDAATPREI